MPTYITLSSFTDQGVRKAKDSPKRAEAFKEMAKKHGVTVRDIYWTQGRYERCNHHRSTRRYGSHCALIEHRRLR